MISPFKAVGFYGSSNTKDVSKEVQNKLKVREKTGSFRWAGAAGGK